MDKVKVLIVEDEAIIALDIQSKLNKLGYDVVGTAKDSQKALELFKSGNPDLVLLDIQIKGDVDGIELAKIIQNERRVPFIYLTSHSDRATVKRAIDTNPGGYIPKPFEEPDLFTAIEVALSNFNIAAPQANGEDAPQQEASTSSEEVPDYLFVREDQFHVKIKFEDIIWLKANGNNTEIYTKEKPKPYVARMSLKDTASKLSDKDFLRIHKSHIINLNYLDAISPDFVRVNNKLLSVGRAYRDELYAKFHR